MRKSNSWKLKIKFYKNDTDEAQLKTKFPYWKN